MTGDWIETLRRNLAAMEETSFFLGLHSDQWREEPLCCLQLGLAIMLDKPIMLVTPPGTPLPENLRRVAVAVIEADPKDAAGCAKAVKRAVDLMEEEKR